MKVASFVHAFLKNLSMPFRKPRYFLPCLLGFPFESKPHIYGDSECQGRFLPGPAQHPGWEVSWRLGVPRGVTQPGLEDSRHWERIFKYMGLSSVHWKPLPLSDTREAKPGWTPLERRLVLTIFFVPHQCLNVVKAACILHVVETCKIWRSATCSDWGWSWIPADAQENQYFLKWKIILKNKTKEIRKALTNSPL